VVLPRNTPKSGVFGPPEAILGFGPQIGCFCPFSSKSGVFHENRSKSGVFWGDFDLFRRLVQNVVRRKAVL